MTWGKQTTFATLNLIIAELIWRFGRVLHEYRFYPKHYPPETKFRTICNYGFSFNQSCLCLMIITAVVISIQYLSVSTILDGIADQSYLLLIWWLFRFTEMTKSSLNYSDFVRSDSGLDYATGMASSYFHGCLNLILPDHYNEKKGIKQRIEKYECKHDVEFAVKKLIILIPNSLHTRPVIESYLLMRQDGQPLEGLKRDRCGVSRLYVNDVYRILIDGKPYYIALEGATPLLSYFDAINFNLTSSWQMKAMQKEIIIKFYRYLKNILHKWPATKEECELIFYNDYTIDGRSQDVGEVLCLHIKKMWEMDNKR